MHLEERKHALRAEVRARMPKEGFVAASQAAQERLAASSLASAARVVGLYRSLPSECGTASLAAALQSAGKEVCYPAIVPGQRELVFRRALEVFVAGALGIEEPTGSHLALAEIDLLVVPAIAVDLRTSGNHTWSKREIGPYLDKPGCRQLRPANYPEGAQGRGFAVLEGRLGVINLEGRVFMKPLEDPFRTADRILQQLGVRCVL